jgi:hypothetical protein
VAPAGITRSDPSALRLPPAALTVAGLVQYVVVLLGRALPLLPLVPCTHDKNEARQFLHFVR